MELKDWVRAARAHKGWTQQQLGDAVGRTKANIGHWETGKHAPSVEQAAQISEVTGFPLPQMGAPATTSAKVIVLHPEDEPPEDSIQVAEYNVRFSAGNGSTVIDYELTDASQAATYRLAWVQQMRLNPVKLKRFKVKGDSMEPMLFDGDAVLVNTAENDLEQLIDGKVYAIRYGNDLRVKRLYYRRISGELILHSDNSAYKDEELTADQVAEHITIIGRVRDKSGSGGL